MKKSISILVLALLFASCEKETVQTNERTIEYKIKTESVSTKQSVVLNGDTLTANRFTASVGDVLTLNVNQYPEGSISIVVSQDNETISYSSANGLTLRKILTIE